MRIGMMADAYKPHLSGITNYIELNKQYLESAGHDVFVFTFGNLGYKDNESNIIRSPGLPLSNTGYYFNFQYSRSAKQLLQSMDIAHVHHPFLSGRLALRYCRPLGIPILFTNHTRYDLYARAYLPAIPPGISNAALKSYMPHFCAAVDMVISPSPGMANILGQFKVKAPITIVPNGVDIKRFQQPAQPQKRRDLGIPPEDILLVYTGRLSPEKNLKFLLQAFLGTAAAVENVHLLFIGDGPLRADLHESAQASPFAGRVHFTGKLDYAQLPGYLGICDAFVTASISEVHPLSVIEAMASGLPVLGIQSPGVGDTITDGQTGFLSTENLPAFTAKMTRLCLDTAQRKTMGQAARIASQRYAIEHTSNLMLGHYERLRQHKAPGRQPRTF